MIYFLRNYFKVGVKIYFKEYFVKGYVSKDFSIVDSLKKNY
jgi:hypothetical protein